MSTTPSFAMDIDPADTQSIKIQFLPKDKACSTFNWEKDIDVVTFTSPTWEANIAEEAKAIALFSQQQKARKRPVKAVFGATNFEADRITDEAFFFFDITPHDPNGRPYVKASFNSLTHLSILEKEMRHSIDLLAVDDSTFKFSKWKTPHLKLIASMIAPDGEFVFCPSVQYPATRESYTVLTAEEDLAALLKKINPFSSNMLLIGYAIPKLVPSFSPEDINKPKVQTMVAKYDPLKPFTNLSYGAFMKKYKELGLENLDHYPPATIKDEKLLKTIIAKSMASQAAQPKIIKTKEMGENLYLSHIKTMLEKHFENVWLERDVPFPVPSRYNDRAPLLFHAKNPKYSL